MARGIVCDSCGAVVKFDAPRGNESESGDESAWVTLKHDNVRDFHACTRECAKALLDGAFGELCDEAFAPIAEIARLIREEREGGDDHD